MTTLTHAQARAYLHAAADDRLPAAERAALDEHLAECAGCRADAAELTSLEADLTQALLRGLEATPLPADLPARVLARSRGAFTRNRLGDALTLALGTGALAIVVGVFAWALGSQPPAEVQPLQGAATEAGSTPTPPPWPTPDFTQQPLQSFPGLVFPGTGSLFGFTLDQPDFGTLVVTLLWEPDDPSTLGLTPAPFSSVQTQVPTDPPAPGLMAFVQLEDGAGQLVAQSDAPLPGSPWGAGSFATITLHPVALPADRPGVYRLFAGVYDSATGARVPAEGTTLERMELGQVTWPLPTATPRPPPGTPTPCQLGCDTATPTPAFLEYFVQAGDTCASIAASFGMPAERLIADNVDRVGPDCSQLVPGTIVLISSAYLLPPTPFSVDTSATPPATFTPCQVGCPEATATATHPPSATPLPTGTPPPPTPTPLPALTESPPSATPPPPPTTEAPPAPAVTETGSPTPWPTLTDTPLPAASATPCEGACPETPTPAPFTPEATATPLPTYTPTP
jgi:hypothetical protein